MLAGSTITVTTANDVIDDTDGVVSLREAIITANANPDENTINFDPSLNGTTIQLSLAGQNEDGALTGDLDITQSIIINGNGANNTVIDANAIDRVLEIFPEASLTLKGVTITGGAANGNGGGILSTNDSYFSISNSVISGNTSSGDGGGIYNAGERGNISNSTIANNSANGDGSGVYNLFGNETTSSAMTIANVTISGNSANQDGGGIYANGFIYLSRSTLTGNRAAADGDGEGAGGGIHSSMLSIDLRNVLVAGNYRGGGSANADDISGTVFDSRSPYRDSFNLIGDAATSGGIIDGIEGNIVGNGGTGTLTISNIIDTTLRDNGGPTPTHALVAGSIAIDTGGPNYYYYYAPQFDQRGEGFARIIGNGMDIGALERGYPTSSIAGYVNGNWWVSSPDASGNYSTSRWGSGQTNPVKVLNGDFNGDGLQDIAAWLPNGQWRVGLANANKTFTFQRWTTWRTNDIKEIQVGDFNGDGKDDIAGLFKRGSKGDWWIAQSDGTRFVATNWGTYGNYDAIASVAIGDFDRTGRDDIAVMASSGRWWIYTSQGDSFTVRSWTKWNMANGVNNILVGDFNRDGRDDIAGLFGTGLNRSWWVALSNGYWFTNQHWARWTVSTSLEGVVAGDFNGDGATDIAGLFNQRSWWVSLANTTTNRFDNQYWATWTFASNGLSDIQVGSSNGDSRADIFARRDNGRWSVLQSTGASFDTRTIARWSSTASWQHVQIGAFYNPSASPALPAARTTGFLADGVNNESQKESVNITRWVALKENAMTALKQSSKKGSLAESAKQPEASLETYEAFGSSRLLDLLYRVP